MPLRLLHARQHLRIGISLRSALDATYARLRGNELSPSTFAGNYALGLGTIVGGQACGGMTEAEAASERARLATLAAIFEARARARSDLNTL
jgi:hypothetical protein